MTESTSGVLTGTIRRIVVDRGFLFVDHGGVDVFVHRSDCGGHGQFDLLEADETVEFSLVVPAPAKGPRANWIRRLS